MCIRVESRRTVADKEVFVLQNNFEKLFRELQTCGLRNGTTVHEVPANRRIRTKFNSTSESTRYMVEDDRDARCYRMIETIDHILTVAQDMAIYTLVVELQHIFQDGGAIGKGFVV